MGTHDLQPLRTAPTAVDGRQSETALMVAQGVRRLFRAAGIASVCELVLSNGRRADVVGLASDGTLHIVEVKSCLQDFRSDCKWPDYLEYCDFFYFAAPPDMDTAIFPADTGLIVADSYGAEIIRPPFSKKINGSKRRVTLLAFARNAALQLHALHDPQTI